VLSLAGGTEFIPVVICAVVGVHFFPLAPVLRDRLLAPLGAAMCLVALAALVVALASAIQAGVVVGAGAGVLLLGYGVMALVRVHAGS
jgi:hypothetical protein